MSRGLEQLLRASVRAEPPEPLDQLVTERALGLARRDAAVTLARPQGSAVALARPRGSAVALARPQGSAVALARPRGSAVARAIVLRLGRSWSLLYRLALQLLQQRPAPRPADTP